MVDIKKRFKYFDDREHAIFKNIYAKFMRGVKKAKGEPYDFEKDVSSKMYALFCFFTLINEQNRDIMRQNQEILERLNQTGGIEDE